jgi:hypothetical protein
MANQLKAFWQWLRAVFGSSDVSESNVTEEMLIRAKLKEKEVWGRVEALEEECDRRIEAFKAAQESGNRSQAARARAEAERAQRNLESARSNWMGCQDNVQTLSRQVNLDKESASIDLAVDVEEYEQKARELYAKKRQHEEDMRRISATDAALDELRDEQKERYGLNESEPELSSEPDLEEPAEEQPEASSGQVMEE